LNVPVAQKLKEDTGSVIRIPPGGIRWEEVEKDLILQALDMGGWVQKEAARLLGLSSRVLNYKIKQFGITHPTWKQNK
jgi:transcriptional regulator with GAF, ATPase, and Fis domain